MLKSHTGNDGVFICKASTSGTVYTVPAGRGFVGHISTANANGSTINGTVIYGAQGVMIPVELPAGTIVGVSSGGVSIFGHEV